MNRGRRGECVFADRKDHETFLAILRESSEVFGVMVAAYCLMSNHYHLLIQTPDANLSRVMRHINGVYTQRYNRRRKIDGSLFRGRYKSVLVENDGHLLELLRYIHRNPVRAKIVKSVDDYAWSSHPAYVAGGREWRWLSTAFLLSMFADDRAIARDRYRDFVRAEDSPDVLEFFARKNVPSLFGTEGFVSWAKASFFEKKQHREVPQAQRLAPSITRIKRAVCRVFGVSEKVLATSVRGRINKPRNLAIYLARKLSQQRLDEIAGEFGLGSYSSVSSAVTRTESILAQDRDLALALKKVKKELQLSQAKT